MNEDINEQLIAALHESAHVVTAYVLKFKVDRVLLGNNGVGSGECKVDFSNKSINVTILKNYSIPENRPYLDVEEIDRMKINENETKSLGISLIQIFIAGVYFEALINNLSTEFSNLITNESASNDVYVIDRINNSIIELLGTQVNFQAVVNRIAVNFNNTDFVYDMTFKLANKLLLAPNHALFRADIEEILNEDNFMQMVDNTFY